MGRPLSMAANMHDSMPNSHSLTHKTSLQGKSNRFSTWSKSLPLSRRQELHLPTTTKNQRRHSDEHPHNTSQQDPPSSATTTSTHKRFSLSDKPIPSVLQSLSSPPSDPTAIRRARFDPKMGNYRPHGVTDWTGFVRKCLATGSVAAVPKVFYDPRVAYLTAEQNRLCVLLALVRECGFPFERLTFADRFVLEEYWDVCGGRPHGLRGFGNKEWSEKIMVCELPLN